jgi:hypothetical protein
VLIEQDRVTTTLMLRFELWESASPARCPASRIPPSTQAVDLNRMVSGKSCDL